MNIAAVPGSGESSGPGTGRSRPPREGADPPARAGGRETADQRLADLVSRASRGHEDAFAELYDLTSSRVYGLVLRVLRSADHAAEVTQEAYVEIWRQAARYDPSRGSVMAWITTLAHRRAVDRVRAVSSATARDERYAGRSVEREVDQVWDGVEQRFDEERVRKGLASLTAVQREALTLAYFGGYTQSEVASLLKLPLGTAKTRIRDGLIGLRDALGVEA
jgi:RNA polymerase sigma-70 factor (ECF subfamily)